MIQAFAVHLGQGVSRMQPLHLDSEVRKNSLHNLDDLSRGAGDKNNLKPLAPTHNVYLNFCQLRSASSTKTV